MSMLTCMYILQFCMARPGEPQNLHAKVTHWKLTEGLAICATVSGRLIQISRALPEECRAWRAGLLHFLIFDLDAIAIIISSNMNILCLQIQLMYKGTLRVLLVLLHDFPEFLCDYHFTFCDVIPPSCIQMRNIILSAFPRNMRLPDPSTPNLKVSE